MTSLFVKFKILLVCLLLLAMGTGAVWVVLEQVRLLLAPDREMERMNERNSMVNTMLYYMYKSESDGIQLLLGNKGYSSAYYGNLRIIFDTLDSLKAFSSDSLQVARVDSISALFSLKEKTLLSMAGNADISAYNKEINNRIKGFMPDSAALRERMLSTTNTVVRRDTILTKRNTGNFFSRVKNVFKKSHSDSTIIVTSSTDTDSTHLALADSVSAVLGDLQRDISNLQKGAVARQHALWSEWAEENSEINALILRLIKDFESDEMSEMIKNEAKKETENDTTVKLLAAIAIVSIAAVLFFLWIIWRDLERSNHYRKELERINKSNRELMSARENLMLAITHDIKAPLGSIIGYTDLLARIASDGRQKLYVSSIKASSDLLLSLVIELLEFYKLDSNKEDLKILPFNVKGFFQSVYEIFLPMAEKKNLKLSLSLNVSDKLSVESDPIKLKQIVNNLINNAIKFTDEGGVEIVVDVRGNELEVCVKDTGCGISDIDKERMFDAFVRLDSSQGVQGFGLGLSIVDRTVALMGGSISVDSAVGSGSEFKVCLPVNVVDDTGAEDTVVTDDKKGAAGFRVLLIDDDELQMNLVCEICKNNGIVPDKCQYPSYASKMVSEAKYDMVVTDIQMPEMSGFDVLSSIRSVDAGIPVVAVTARSVNREEYLKAGFADVLAKPFKETDFMGIVNRYLKEPACPECHDEKELKGLSAMLQFAGDDEAARKEILVSFVSQTEDNLNSIDAAYKNCDVDLLMSLCHKMLPIFAMMGENDIVFILKKYENGVTPDAMITADEMAKLTSEIKDIVEKAKKEVYG